MKNTKTVLVGLLVLAVALSTFVTPAAAEFVHPRGLWITTYPQRIVVYWGPTGSFEKTLAVWVMPPWYFVQGLMSFDTITLTIRLESDCWGCKTYGNNPLKLAGADSSGTVTVNWSNVVMTEAENGALLLVPITFIVGGFSNGFYQIALHAEAHASGATFVGNDWIHVAIAP